MHEEEKKAEKNFPPVMKRSLTRPERLSRRSDIRSVFSDGKRFSFPGVRMHYRKNGLDISRVLVTTVKKYGNAVERNRARRRGKEIWRLFKEHIKPGYDVVFVFFPGTYTFHDRSKVCRKLLIKASIANSP